MVHLTDAAEITITMPRTWIVVNTVLKRMMSKMSWITGCRY